MEQSWLQNTSEELCGSAAPLCVKFLCCLGQMKSHANQGGMSVEKKPSYPVPTSFVWIYLPSLVGPGRVVVKEKALSLRLFMTTAL